MQEMSFEEFKKLRREVFLRGVYGLILLAVMIVLMVIMATGTVADSNVYRFRTISFIIGLAYVGYIMVLARRVAPLQKAHPEWIEKTAVKNGPIELPGAWNRNRLIVTLAAIAAVGIAFFTLYKPGTGVVYDAQEDAVRSEIVSRAGEEQRNDQIQGALDGLAIESDIQGAED